MMLKPQTVTTEEPESNSFDTVSAPFLKAALALCGRRPAQIFRHYEKLSNELKKKEEAGGKLKTGRE